MTKLSSHVNYEKLTHFPGHENNFASAFWYLTSPPPMIPHLHLPQAPYTFTGHHAKLGESRDIPLSARSQGVGSVKADTCLRVGGSQRTRDTCGLSAYDSIIHVNLGAFLTTHLHPAVICTKGTLPPYILHPFAAFTLDLYCPLVHTPYTGLFTLSTPHHLVWPSVWTVLEKYIII